MIRVLDMLSTSIPPGYWRGERGSLLSSVAVAYQRDVNAGGTQQDSSGILQVGRDE